MINKRGVIVLLTVLLVLTISASAAVVDQEVLDALDSQEEVSVIVVLKDQPVPERGIGIASANADEFSRRKEMISGVQDMALGKLKVRERREVGKLGIASTEDYDFDLKHRYSIINGFSGKVTQEGMDKLIATGQVSNIYIDGIKQIFLNDSNPLINADDVWNISVGGTQINGSGQTVCIIDTGIDYNHTALGGGWGNKILNGYDFVNSDTDPYDDHGHGTHVAGIVASTNNTYRGVAPEAKLIAIKACNSAGSCSDANVLAGIDWCINNATTFNISVISISLGGGQYTTYCDSSVNAQYANLTNLAVSRNISVVIATGNTGNGYLNATAGIASPACIQNATRVSATTKADVIASYAFRHSNFRDILMAPGSSITSTNDGGGFISDSGTSMATPQVSGAIALIRQYWKQTYNQTPTTQQIINKLIITGTKIDDSAGSGINYSRINLLAAIQPFINFTSSSPANATTITATNTIINITSDVNLSIALLEWNNGTLTNYTMNSSNAASFYYNMTGLTTTNYTYKVYGNDSAGTFGVSETRLIIVDQTPPNITIYTPINNSHYRQALNLNISLANLQLSFSNYLITNTTNATLQTNTNNSIGSANYSWTDSINLSNSTFPNGNYTLTVFANDSLGNSATSSVIFTVDKTNPNIINISLHPSIVYNNDSITFKINVTDNIALNTSMVYFESNFSTNWTNYSMNNENNITFNFTLTGTSNLSNQRSIFYKFNANDYAGNTNTSINYNFTVQNRIPFALNITTQTNGTILELGNSTSFNATATDLDGDTLTYYWNFSDNTSLATGQNTTHSFNSTGNFIVILNVSDGYSSNLTNITIVVNDTSPPTVATLTYDTELHLQQNGATLSISGTTQDYSGILNLTLNYNGTLFNRSCTITSTAWNCNWTISSLTVGSYNFTLDYADNFTTTHTNSSTYYFNVTSCSDSTKNGDETATDCGGSCSACSSSSSSSSSSSGGGGGGGGGGGAGGATTYIVSDTQLNTGYTTALGKGDKMKFTISDEEHYLTMESMTSVSASFTVMSKVYHALLSLGEEMKFELDDDNYYDIKAKLNGVDTTTVKANMTIQMIHELMPGKITTTESKANKTIVSNATNITSAENITALEIKEAFSIESKGWFWELSWEKTIKWSYWKYVLAIAAIIGLLLIVPIWAKLQRRKKNVSKSKYPFP
jgi:subtilisin family serine protease/uncharacterized membrane protein YgcG